MDFWTIFAAVLCAGLLLITFVWGAVVYSRHEQSGTEGSSASHGPAVAMMMPPLFALASLLIATDNVPAWLNFIAQ